jgi:hypothetical protein
MLYILEFSNLEIRVNTAGTTGIIVARVKHFEIGNRKSWTAGKPPRAVG